MPKQPYGGITNIPKYMTDQYNTKGTLIKHGRALNMNQQSMEEISGRRTRNCSVVAVTRIIDYYRRTLGIRSIPEDIREIYRLVEEVATAYGYTDKRGTIPLFISGITKEAFKQYGIRTKCRGVYIWSFEKHVAREISEGRPVIMNLARGFYKDHTIVVSGYSIWRAGNKVLPMLRVIDGWNKGIHYVDYESFSKDISQSIFGSFNLTYVKGELLEEGRKNIV